METGHRDFRQTNIYLKNIDVHRPGQIIIFVFLEDGFPKDHSKAVRSYTFQPDKPELVIPIEAPARAEFAIKVLHDEDMDAMVTKNWTGYLPKEGLGFSAGVTILGGALTFKKAKVTFHVNEIIEVSMRYPGRFGI